jgi:hypothetical protein
MVYVESDLVSNLSENGEADLLKVLIFSRMMTGNVPNASPKPVAQGNDV